MTLAARLLRMLRALCGLVLVLLMALAWVVVGGVSDRLAARLAGAGWAVLLAAFGIRIVVRGTPQGHALHVANHVSWVDIPVLARLTGAAFVTKDSIRAWPVIGWLAQRLGCRFVDRQRPLDARRQATELSSSLGSRGLVLFPEGTTSDGLSVLPFRTSLFAAAQGSGMAVQPVALTFRGPDGEALDPAGRRAVAWLDDDALLPHAFALAARGGAVVEVWFEPPVPPGHRKDVARACRAAILARLEAVDQAATLNRAA